MADWLDPKGVLLALVLAPLLMALVSVGFPQDFQRTRKAFGCFGALAALGLWGLLGGGFSDSLDHRLVIVLPWVPSWGIAFRFTLSYTAWVIGGVVVWASLLAHLGSRGASSEPGEQASQRIHVFCLLLAETGLLGTCLAGDLVLFLVFWEMALVPLFVLMGREELSFTVSDTSRFLVLSVMSSMLMMVGMMLTVREAGGTLTFDIQELATRLAARKPAGMMGIWLMVPAFLVRMAIVPFHTWLPRAAATISSSALLLLVGGLMPVSAFGIVLVLQPLAGIQWPQISVWLGWMGLVSALGCGMAAVVQKNLHHLLAFACASQMGLALALIGFAPVDMGVSRVAMLVSASLGSACMFLFAMVVTRARASQRIADLGGLWRVHPALVGLAFAGAASIAAVPGTIGFLAVFELLRVSTGIWETVFVLGALLLSGGAVLWAHQRINGGSYYQELWDAGAWPLRRQVVLLALVALLTLALGIFPGWLGTA